MIYRVQLFRGLKDPYIIGHQLTKAEKIEGTWKYTIILTFASFLLYSISAYLGIGSDILSKQIYQLTSADFEATKLLFAIGQVLAGVLGTILFIFFPALVFWLFSDTYYMKLVNIQLIITTIILLEKAISIPFQYYLGLDPMSLPYSLGVIAQYFTDYRYIILVLAQITFFQIWVIVLQYTYVKAVMDRSKSVVLAIVISTNVCIWLVLALFSYIDFEKLL
ncbi:hypothetical protein M3175_15630 [Robertmurraya korlensis]|uniref:hypothetical protein n=1 Tax=Robertmurraya korlensis TaxID=519977 RepID=UPI0020422EE3|nr:hypothetical protein [Robertmurraya korlensis]MCM3602173.1 hypothetical protein [Robertmurraya korlensis]